MAVPKSNSVIEMHRSVQAVNSRFPKIVGPIMRGAMFIPRVVFGTAFLIAVTFIFPPYLLVFREDILNQNDEDAVDDFMFGLSAIFHMFLDALFLYVPLINEETKCVMLDNRLKIAAIVLRSVGDIRYLVRIIYRIKNGLQKSHPLKKIAMGVANDMLCILPVPQVLGAFWYFFSIQRETDCWGHVCQIDGCEFSTSCVENTFRNITHIKNLCPINPPDATAFDFGIFLYALQSGMQESTNFSEKFMQCFSWGLRNLSSFVSNLNSSTYGWENFFVVVISISGLILFMYLLGHSQTYMQETDRRESIKRKMKMIIEPKIRSLLSDYRLPTKEDSTRAMEFRIKRAVKLILEKDEDFIVENMFSILSFNLPELQDFKERLDSEIKFNLLLDKLKKVEGLKHKGDEVLKKICELLEPKIYTEGSYIIQEGTPLDMMFFVTQGTVLTYRTNNERNIKVIEKEKDSLHGEELLTLAEWTSSKLSSLPISTISVKSHKKVEVFALNAADLQKVVSEFPNHFNMSHMAIVVHNNSSNISASREINEGRAKRGDVSKRDQGYQSY